MPKHTNKVRINITLKPDLLKRIDKAAGKFQRSVFIGEACAERIKRDEQEVIIDYNFKTSGV